MAVAKTNKNHQKDVTASEVIRATLRKNLKTDNAEICDVLQARGIPVPHISLISKMRKAEEEEAARRFFQCRASITPLAAAEEWFKRNSLRVPPRQMLSKIYFEVANATPSQTSTTPAAADAMPMSGDNGALRQLQELEAAATRLSKALAEAASILERLSVSGVHFTVGASQHQESTA